MTAQGSANNSSKMQAYLNQKPVQQQTIPLPIQNNHQLNSLRNPPYNPHNFYRLGSEQRPQVSSQFPQQPGFPQQPQAINNQAYPNNSAPPFENETIYYYIIGLFDTNNKELFLAELSKRRDQYPDLALVLWNSYGIMTILYQEVISVYPLLNPPALSAQQSNKVCNALALLQLIATHEQTRMPFLKANIPQLLYPFLSTSNKTKPYDNLRLTSLGVIGALYDNPEVIGFFFSTEFLPLCLKIMDIGSELCKVIATFIFQKIIADPGGYHYVVSHSKRLKTVVMILNNVVTQLVETQSLRLLKSVTKCYLRLADDPSSRQYLQANLPEFFQDGTFSSFVTEDATYRKLLFQLLYKISNTSAIPL
ncbi:hypothetical protein BB558_004597 [Smittium angustum]|uniref:Cell differentiation protein rcd1 n=1 Tax=Smittium angustum TaxID=133377 RepID=A0A2U1J2X5_SMIAN|nr:hypothetical protein BB558_004597 [Smittium angustum]